MDPAQFAKVFPVGSHLCREPMPPMAELKRDMENLRRHGFNLVKLQEHWALDEPVEGRCDFGRCEELIEHAAALDLGVYVGLTCEQAPHWLWRKHPDCRMVARSGLPVAYEAAGTLPADGKPGPCFDHPGAAADMRRFITALVRTLGRYENVVVWNTWQEIGYWAEADWLAGESVCFCAHTLAHFRRWLRDAWRDDLDALNRAWRTRYGAWDDVTPNRNRRAREGMMVDAAWSHFMANVQVPAVLRMRAETIRAADPMKRPVFAHKGSPAVGSGQDWTLARCQDFLGSSSYPAWSPFHGWDDRPETAGRVDRHAALVAEVWNGIVLPFDYVRSANEPGRPVWAAELQGGPVSTALHKGRVPAPADLRRWMLAGVGSGLSGICFWVTRAEIAAAECNGFSLLDSTGDTTPRYEEASRVAAALGRWPDLFGPGTWPPAPAAILINEAGWQVCGTVAAAAEHLAYSVRGWHRFLWEANVPVDFLEAGQLEERGSGYRMLILPFPLSLGEGLAAALERYVDRGGHLVSEACPGRLSEYAFSSRGELAPAAARLFGVAQRGLALVREPDDGRRWSPRERTWGEFLDPAVLQGEGPLAGCALRANFYIETYDCADARPCLMHGDRVAGAVRRAGRGQAWLLGTLAGHAGLAYRDPAGRALVRRLLAECGVEPAHPGKLILRRRAGPGREAWIFLNPEAEAVTEDVDVTGWERVEDLLGEPLGRRGSVVPLTVEALDVRALILSRA